MRQSERRDLFGRPVGANRLDSQKSSRIRKKKGKKWVRLGWLLLILIVAGKGVKGIHRMTENITENVPPAATGGWMISMDREEEESGTPDWLTEDYPDSLKELYELNPETKDFVRDYFKEKDKQHEIALTDEVTKGEIPLFLQWDKRWGYESYGSDLMAVTGCGPTCLSMVICGLTGSTTWNPLEVAKVAEQNGFYVDGSGSSWSLMTEGAQLFGLTPRTVTFDEEHIRGELSQGHPIICVMGPGDFTTTGHFIVLSGLDGEGKVTVRDPNSRKRSEVSWDLQKLMGQMQNLWSYSYE